MQFGSFHGVQAAGISGKEEAMSVPLQVVSIIVSVFMMLLVQTAVWVYKFGKLEQKVTDQNGRIERLEDCQDEKTN